MDESVVQGLDCRDVKPGDMVKRMLAGIIPMTLRVTEVDEHLIHCGPQGWTFDRKTGFEVDDDLGWGPSRGVTGSYIIEWTSNGGEMRNE